MVDLTTLSLTQDILISSMYSGIGKQSWPEFRCGTKLAPSRRMDDSRFLSRHSNLGTPDCDAFRIIGAKFSQLHTAILYRRWGAVGMKGMGGQLHVPVA